MIGVPPQVLNLGRDDFHAIPQTHRQDAPTQCVHPGGTPIHQNQLKVWPFNSNHESRHPSPGADIHHRSGTTLQGGQELPGVGNCLGNRTTSQGSPFLGVP